ncbi:hypothetical protein G6038_09805 [Rhodococcus sp. 14C212]|uniref:hypothetical protein n=1 Tax=Rhodococcus sp. 14C212 TaxID=2711209 RepID=UPI0013EDDC2E|nr:hypothetical protein [Rhodococcus sp. 14C212]NGP05769.1 hypothetical protein [Rhodococcus sp. 14C212]
MTRLFELPARDFGSHSLLLSVLGELRKDEVLDGLVDFISLPPESIFPSNPRQPDQGDATTYPDDASALQARAVEMLAFLRTAKAFGKVLEIAGRHPSKGVRIAALDAFVFNHDDSAEALEAARAAARPDEVKFVGLARLERNSDPREFDAKVRAFYEHYPEELPKSPIIHPECGQAPAKHPQPRNAGNGGGETS